MSAQQSHQTVGSTKYNIFGSLLIALTTAIITTYFNFYFTQKTQFEQAIWTQKRDAYVQALRVVNRALRSEPNDSGFHFDPSVRPTPEEINDSYVELATFSNGEILKAYDECVMNPNKVSINGSRDALINLIRKDLGINSLNLNENDSRFSFGGDPQK